MMPLMAAIAMPIFAMMPPPLFDGYAFDIAYSHISLSRHFFRRRYDYASSLLFHASFFIDYAALFFDAAAFSFFDASFADIYAFR